METVIHFISIGYKNTVDGDCSREIKRHLLFGRKAMTNSALKSKSITLPTALSVYSKLLFIGFSRQEY